LHLNYFINQTSIRHPINISDIKFSNIEYISCGDGFNMIYEREDKIPLEKWTEKEVYNWFKEMNLDEYLNIIKYKTINGLNIIQADDKYFSDNFGMEDDIIMKIQYDVNKMKNNSSCKNMKLWGWGNNKNGQLGQTNYEKDYIKSLRKINLPELKENDFIIYIKIVKNYSIFITKFGEIYITGNYSMKTKYQESLILKNDDNQIDNINININNTYNNKKTQTNKDKKNKKERKDSNISNKDKDLNLKLSNNKWVNITKRVCFDSLKENQNDDLRK
jgi:hypothetical protein